MVHCSQQNCKFATTSVCLEGHEKDCPFQLDSKDASEGLTEPQESLRPDVSVPETHVFHSGEKLNHVEASRILFHKPATVVLCVGSQGSGKTTLIARVGELFREGQFQSYKFRSSLTLCAFERASWLAMIESGSSKPTTPRTFRPENDHFLHLGIYKTDSPWKTKDILISDFSGETFSNTISSLSACSGLCSLSRADHLVVFLDSESLIDASKRHAECDNAKGFLQRVIKVRGHNLDRLFVHIIFSRWDKIALHPSNSALEKFCEDTQTDLTNRFSGSFAGIDFWRIAARPEHPFKRTDMHTQELFETWTKTPIESNKPIKAKNTSPARDFSSFGISV